MKNKVGITYHTVLSIEIFKTIEEINISHGFVLWNQKRLNWDILTVLIEIEVNQKITNTILTTH